MKSYITAARKGKRERKRERKLRISDSSGYDLNLLTGPEFRLSKRGGGEKKVKKYRFKSNFSFQIANY